MDLKERAIRFVGWGDLRSAGPRGLLRPLLAELVGTELLVLLAVGAGLWSGHGADRTISISLAAGFTVAVIIESIFHVSGGHINPAVTAGVVAAGHMPLLRGLLYMVAQILGGLLGSGMLFFLTPAEMLAGGVTKLGPGVSAMQGMTIESMITLVLVFAAFATLDENRTDVKISPPYVIGLSVAIGHLYGMHATGASMNPARSFGPAVVTGIWTHQWIYWLGPLSGGISGAMMYKLLFAAPARNVAAQSVQNKEAEADTGC